MTSAPIAYTTQVVTDYTTYCPEATSLTYGKNQTTYVPSASSVTIPITTSVVVSQTTMTVSQPTTITINSMTYPVSPVSGMPTTMTMPVTMPISSPVGAAMGSSTPAPYAPSGMMPSAYGNGTATMSAKPSTYTGAASKAAVGYFAAALGLVALL